MTIKEDTSRMTDPEYPPGHEAELLRRELQQAEAALCRARMEFEQVLDMVTSGMRIIYKDHNIRALNRAFAEMSGVSMQQAAGRHCYEVFPGNMCRSPQCPLTRIMAGEETVCIEMERRRADGSAVPCEITALPYRDVSGETVGIIETFRDISLRRSMQAQLLESEERYRALVSLGGKVGEAVVMLQDEAGREGLQTFVSDEWPRITGYSRKELLKMSFFDLVIPSEQEASLERHRLRMSGKILRGLFEINITRKDGMVIPVELTSACSMYMGKRANVAYIRDISERKRSEEQLKRQATLLKAQLDSSIDGIMVVDGQGNRLLQNDSVNRIWGIDESANKDEHGNRMSRVAFRTKDPEKFREVVLGVARDPVARIRDEVELVDGKVIERYSAPVVGADGTRYGRIWNFHDVTENKKAERALKESEELYRALFENTGTATSLTEDSGTVVLVNSEFEKLLGYSKSEIEGKMNWASFVHPSDLAAARKHDRNLRAAPSGVPAGFEMRLVDRNKRIKNVIITVNAIPGSTRRIASLKDITHRKKIEKDLKKSRQRIRNLLEHVEEIREEERKRIAGEIHDELGQLLTALKMDVVWLAKHMPEAEQSIQEKARSMRQTIDMTIQSVKRISAELRPHVLDNLGLSAAIEWQVKQINDVTGIECRFTSSPPDVASDSQTSIALFRIFQEAITNAVRHSNASQVTVGLRQVPGHIRLVIEDNGSGIKSSEINDARSFGLISMKERARAIGGDMEIAGHTGKGTVITIEIPLAYKEGVNGKDTDR